MDVLATTSLPEALLNSTSFDKCATVKREARITTIAVTRGILASIATYLFVIQWIYYHKKFGWRVTKKSRKILLETVLITVAVICALSFMLSMYFFGLLDSYYYPTIIKGLPHGLGIDIVQILSFGVTLTLCYSVLWLRQRVIYANPALPHLSNKVSRIISKYFIVYVVISGLAGCLAVITTASLGICSINCHETFLWVIFTTWPFTIQITLLLLMVRPLYKHHTTNMISNPKYFTLMKRIAIVTTICLISDLVTLSVHLVFCKFRIPPEVNLIVNVFCVTLIPRDWKEKMLPCFKTKSQQQNLKSMPLSQRHVL